MTCDNALVVHYTRDFEDLRLQRFPDRAVAEAVWTGASRRTARYAFIVQRPDDLLGFALAVPDGVPANLTLTGNDCAAIYNFFSSEKVDKFANRTAGAERVHRILTSIAQSLPMEGIMTKKTKKAPLGAAKQVRENSSTGQVLAAVLGGERTIDEIAVLTGLDADKVGSILRRTLRSNHGIRHDVGEDGRVTAVLPEQYDAETVFKRPVTKETGAPRRSANTDLDEAAQRGEYPEKPVVTSATNAHRQKHLDKLHAWAEQGMWDEVAKFRMNGIDTYSKLINRYRDRLLWAHNAQGAEQEHAA